MGRMSGAILALLAATMIPSLASAFQVANQVTLPLKIDRTQPMSRPDIFRRIGGNANAGSKDYTLRNEHEVVYPITGTHQGILAGSASFTSPSALDDAESVANHSELVSRAVLAGSLAASVRNWGTESDTAYYVPSAVTLVESLLCSEVSSLFTEEEGACALREIFAEDDVVLYAYKTHSDKYSATSDVYVLPAGSCWSEKSRVWRFSVEYMIATIDLRQIISFPTHIPDVWLKNDCY